jgi:hypothetical protein
MPRRVEAHLKLQRTAPLNLHGASVKGRRLRPGFLPSDQPPSLSRGLNLWKTCEKDRSNRAWAGEDHADQQC